MAEVVLLRIAKYGVAGADLQMGIGDGDDLVLPINHLERPFLPSGVAGATVILPDLDDPTTLGLLRSSLLSSGSPAITRLARVLCLVGLRSTWCPLVTRAWRCPALLGTNLPVG